MVVICAEIQLFGNVRKIRGKYKCTAEMKTYTGDLKSLGLSLLYIHPTLPPLL